MIHDRVRGMVETIPWPTKCPWGEGYEYVVVSRDFSRVAVTCVLCCGGEDLINVEIWDRWHGLIGELDWHEPDTVFDVKPIFSPDGQLLLVPLVTYNDTEWVTTGIQAAQLPPRDKKGPIIVMEHHNALCGVRSFTFTNNDNIAVEDDTNVGINLWAIRRVNGYAYFCFSKGFSKMSYERLAFLVVSASHHSLQRHIISSQSRVDLSSSFTMLRENNH